MRLGLLFCLVAGALGCRTPAEARADASPAPPRTPVAASVSSSGGGAFADAAALESIHTERSYRGALGTSKSIEMSLDRDGSMVTGSYRYASVGRDLALAGEVQSNGTMTLTERPMGKGQEAKPTGRFTLGFRPDGSLAGTWSDATATKTLPVQLALRGVLPASRDQFLDFAERLVRTEKKPPMTRAELDAAIQGTETFWPEESQSEVLMDHGVFFALASLYLADVNNDGTRDYVFLDKNTVSIHNDQLMGVYDEDGDALRRLPFDDIASASLFDGGDVGPSFPTYRDSPFLEVTPKGVVMRWMNLYGVDARGATVRMIDPCDKRVEEHFVYLWRGPTITVVEHTKRLVPCS